MLTKLPPEVFSIITDNLAKSDLKSLSRVSRHTHALSARALWRSMRLTPMPESKLHYIRPASMPQIRYQLTTELHVCSNFQFPVGGRGPRMYADYDDHSLAQRLELVLGRLADNQLRSFSWGLATCIPPEFLGSRGILALRQSGLRSLHIVTEHTCHHDSEVDCEIDLSPFRSLRSIGWKIPDTNNLATLSVALRSNSIHLQELDLDLVDWEDLMDDGDESDESDNNQARTRLLDTIFGLSGRSPSPYFPDIRILSLARVPLTTTLVSVINFGSLTSLTLRVCPGYAAFLDHIVKQNYSIRLKRLEIQASKEDGPPGPPIMKRFIRTCEGLEELFIHDLELEDSTDLWEYAAHHKATLKTFVYDQRMPHAGDDPSYEELLDFGGRFQQLRNDPIQHNPLAVLDLACIGLSCAPAVLEALLQPYKSKTSLRLVHLRQPRRDMYTHGSLGLERDFLHEGGMKHLELNSEGPDLDQERALQGLQGNFRQFLEWAYGLTGLASLQIVAFGDFAVTDVYSPCNVMVCRDADEKTNFRILGPYDTKMHRILSEFRDVLGACPSESSIRREWSRHRGIETYCMGTRISDIYPCLNLAI